MDVDDEAKEGDEDYSEVLQDPAFIQVINFDHLPAEIVETTFGCPKLGRIMVISCLFFSFPHVMNIHFFKQMSVLGTDFRFWT